MNHRVAFHEVAALAVSQRREVDEVQRPVGHDEELAGIRNVRLNRIPHRAAQTIGRGDIKRFGAIASNHSRRVLTRRGFSPFRDQGFDRRGRSERSKEDARRAALDHERAIGRHDRVVAEGPMPDTTVRS